MKANLNSLKSDIVYPPNQRSRIFSEDNNVMTRFSSLTNYNRPIEIDIETSNFNRRQNQ